MAWSEAARKAAIEARRQHAGSHSGGTPNRIELDSYSSRFFSRHLKPGSIKVVSNKKRIAQLDARAVRKSKAFARGR